MTPYNLRQQKIIAHRNDITHIVELKFRLYLTLAPTYCALNPGSIAIQLFASTTLNFNLNICLSYVVNTFKHI